MKGRNHSSDSRDSSRPHYVPGGEYSLESVHHSSHTFFHYNIVFVFDGTFPRMGQEVGEDILKDKQGK